MITFTRSVYEKNIIHPLSIYIFTPKRWRNNNRSLKIVHSLLFFGWVTSKFVFPPHSTACQSPAMHTLAAVREQISQLQFKCWRIKKRMIRCEGWHRVWWLAWPQLALCCHTLSFQANGIITGCWGGGATTDRWKSVEWHRHNSKINRGPADHLSITAMSWRGIGWSVKQINRK